MAKFIDQELFDMCALTVLKYSNDEFFHEAARITASSYDGDYQDVDPAELIIAAEKLREAFGILLPHSDPSAAATQLQYCVKKFNLDGSKKRTKLFGGTWFSGEREPIMNKVDRCLHNMTTYHTLVMAGVIPLAPKGWTL